jgi:signal transduction histidine kinase
MGLASLRSALTLAIALTAIICALFGFVYWETDTYLTTRSDQMIVTQLNVLSVLRDRSLTDAIDEHLKQDSRGVQFAALFGPDGSRVTGNIASMPSGLDADASAHCVQIVATGKAGPKDHVIQAVARRLPGGQTLVIGRLVDEVRDIGHVIGRALLLGLVCSVALCLLTAAFASLRARKRVEEVNRRIERIVAGDLRERLPHRDDGAPYSKLAASVNGMLDEMETMFHALAGVGNDIAHDLRTPLTRARLTLERGRTHAVTLEQLQAAADKAVAGIDQSLTIITALLRLAEIENSRQSAAFGAVALNKLLREVGDLYEPIAEDKGVTITVDAAAELSVHGDRDLLIEAVANLVDNAVKFTPAGGRVRLDLFCRDGESVVRVSDTGSGIADSEREAVLRRFFRSEKNRTTPGFGLGLNLVVAILKLHGFRMAIFPGPGCRIEIVCPDRTRAGLPNHAVQAAA